MRFTFPILLIIGLAYSTGFSEESESKIDLFYVPWAMHLCLPDEKSDDPFGSQQTREYPVIRNPIPDLASGVLYDVRGYFGDFGFELGESDLAWFSPESDLLFVRSDKEGLKGITAIIESTHWHPEMNLTISGAIRESELGGASQEREKSEISVEWSLIGKTGHKTKSSLEGKGPISYHLDLDPVIGPDGETFDAIISMKATVGENEVTLETDAAGRLGESVSFLLYRSKSEKKEAWFEFEIEVDYVSPFTGLKPEKDKKKLIDEISKHLKVAGSTIEKNNKR